MDGFPEGFVNVVKQVENGVKRGWDKVKGKWFPHASAEGGLKTIAYGHKCTSNNEQSQYEQNGMSEAQADAAIRQDLSNARAAVKNYFDDFNSLGLLQFNVGSITKQKWPKLHAACINKNFQEALLQSKRGYTSPDGKRHELTQRHNDLCNYYQTVQH